MDQTSHTLQIIYGGIDDYNMDLPDSDRLEKSLETILFSPGGKLDSVGFVALSTAIEARIQKISGQAFPLFTQEALNRPDQPLKSVGTLAAYLAEKLRP